MHWPSVSLRRQTSAQPKSIYDSAGEAGLALPRLHSLLVSARGQLVLERYYRGMRADRPANIKSASKSVISALVGIAIDRKLIKGVSQPIHEFFPDIWTRPVDEAKRAITIEHLLMMQSGLESTSSRNYGAWVRSANWVSHALSRPLIRSPGTEMDYSTGNSHLLSAILQKSSGKTTRALAQQFLAQPLGFTLSEWPRDPQGVYFGGNDMLMTPRQMLAFGELYLRNGTANGQRVLSCRMDSHLADSTRPFAMERSRIRIRLVDSRAWWPLDVLCVGLRRAVHLRRAFTRARRGHDVGVNRRD